MKINFFFVVFLVLFFLFLFLLYNIIKTYWWLLKSKSHNLAHIMFFLYKDFSNACELGEDCIHNKGPFQSDKKCANIK